MAYITHYTFYMLFNDLTSFISNAHLFAENNSLTSPWIEPQTSSELVHEVSTNPQDHDALTKAVSFCAIVFSVLWGNILALLFLIFWPSRFGPPTQTRFWLSGNISAL